MARLILYERGAAWLMMLEVESIGCSVRWDPHVPVVGVMITKFTFGIREWGSDDGG